MTSRRKFIKKMTIAGAATVMVPELLKSNNIEQPITTMYRNSLQKPVNNNLQIALIGAGGMGLADAKTALRHEGVKLVAVADLYDSRLVKANEIFGKEIQTTRDYRQILERNDIDAVIIATHDHWHKDIAVNALIKGKHVYLEKPMVHSISEGPELIAAQKKSGKVLEVGSQLLSSLGYEKAKKLVKSGAIGNLNLAEGVWQRRTAVGAWNYDIPADASPKTIDWDTFLKDKKRFEFDPERFFRWRKYLDYGTGMNGDLFVHIISGLHFVMDSYGPNKIYSSGGIRFWNDGREVPDVLVGTFDYPDTKQHRGFNLSLRCNFVDGTNSGYVMRMTGSEGMLEVYENKVTLFRNKVFSNVDPVMVLDKADNKEARKKMIGPEEIVYKAQEDYRGSHYDHFGYWLNAIRNESDVVENTAFGYRAAAPAILCNESDQENKVVEWDPVKMEKI
ncbi:MAG: Gfo/Idh/MocA family oxidoreductase [Bacteroidales bacterium]|nr:Gfo/Idh/MocA family oxidoreductase [Bacteroidales bacterium]